MRRVQQKPPQRRASSKSQKLLPPLIYFSVAFIKNSSLIMSRVRRMSTFEFRFVQRALQKRTRASRGFYLRWLCNALPPPPLITLLAASTRCISSSARTATRCLVLLRACDKCSIMNMKGCSLLLFSGGVVAFAWDAANGKSACVVLVAQIQV